jgi:hypothetical protein
MITSPQSIRDIFSIFHDGTIENTSLSDGILKLTIDIPYLADRVKNGYKFFYVELDGFRDAEFHAWPAMLGKEKELVSDLAIIFKPALEILEANLKEDQFEVVCNIKSFSNSDYCGGELLFRANSARVRDEANKEYSISELDEICRAYWNEWKMKQDKRG